MSKSAVGKRHRRYHDADRPQCNPQHAVRQVSADRAPALLEIAAALAAAPGLAPVLADMPSAADAPAELPAGAPTASEPWAVSKHLGSRSVYASRSDLPSVRPLVRPSVPRSIRLSVFLSACLPACLPVGLVCISFHCLGRHRRTGVLGCLWMRMWICLSISGSGQPFIPSPFIPSPWRARILGLWFLGCRAAH
jgi:hypothetical protein